MEYSEWRQFDDAQKMYGGPMKESPACKALLSSQYQIKQAELLRTHGGTAQQQDKTNPSSLNHSQGQYHSEIGKSTRKTWKSMGQRQDAPVAGL